MLNKEDGFLGTGVLEAGGVLASWQLSGAFEGAVAGVGGLVVRVLSSAGATAFSLYPSEPQASEHPFTPNRH